MNHRHLLPNEIDLLLDSEVGFGVAPLRAHVEECAPCRAQVDEARAVVEALERIPRFGPAPSFANRVMADVQVIEPWHVALTAAVSRFIPRTTGMRVVFGVTASLASIAISSAAVWLAFRGDVAMYLAGLIDERLRATLTAGAASAVRGLLGSGAIEAIGAQGMAAVAVGTAVAVVAAGSAALGLRAMASASRRSRE
ncbi:MAG: hypothetical protein O2973_04200 [Gemmatimonadetes bacterium]|nr:hypothetical protein [Gemmatimonadota bacterium]